MMMNDDRDNTSHDIDDDDTCPVNTPGNIVDRIVSICDTIVSHAVPAAQLIPPLNAPSYLSVVQTPLLR